MTYSNPTKTVGEVYTYAKRAFGDESGVQMTDADLTRWINDAQHEIAEASGVIPAVATVAVTAGTPTYSLTSVTPLINTVASISLGGRRIANMSVAQAEESISLRDPDGTVNDQPMFWYSWAGSITFWPNPIEDQTMSIRYFAKPTTVTTTQTELLTVPDSCFTDVVNYVLMRAYEMDENPEMMTAKGAEFANSLAVRGQSEMLSQSMTYETGTVYNLI
jgi:hypothetical protein